LLLNKSIQRWSHLLHVFIFTAITHTNVQHLSNGKCNMMSFDKSLCKIPLFFTTLMMFMNAHAIFTWFHLKMAGHLCHTTSNLFSTITFNYP
jgi:hypothetical protein